MPSLYGSTLQLCDRDIARTSPGAGEYVDSRFIVFFIVFYKESGQSHKLQHKRTSTQTVRVCGREIPTTGTDWKSNSADSEAHWVEWGDFNDKGPIPNQSFIHQLGVRKVSGMCEATAVQFKNDNSQVSSPRRWYMTLLMGDTWWGGGRDHHHSRDNIFPGDPNLFFQCFNSIMMQARDKTVCLVGQRPPTLKSILLSTTQQPSERT